MTLADFCDYCLAKPGVTQETPFGPDTLVFKVMSKMFALTGVDDFVSVNLKCDPEIAADLRERHAYVRPGYHMSKQHWNTVEIGTGVSDAQLRAWTDDSYNLIRASLPKKLQAQLDASSKGPRTLAEQEWFDEMRTAFAEAKAHERGEIKLKDAREFLEELERGEEL